MLLLLLFLFFFTQNHIVSLQICALFVVDESGGDDHGEPHREETGTNRRCMFLHTNATEHMGQAKCPLALSIYVCFCSCKDSR